MRGKPPTIKQWQAIRSTARITVAITGPGTGKTFTIARRMWYLTTVRHILPDRILAFTFSNMAAAEMESAVARLCPGVRFPWLGTTHAICGRILEAEGQIFDICDEHKQRELVAAIVKQIAPGQEIDADDIVEYITWRKTRIATDATAASVLWEKEHLPLYRRAYKRYQKRLAIEQLKDFNDLLRDTVELFERFPKVLSSYQKKFSHILADELQDFAPLQVRLLMLLIGTKNNAFLVGDDDQVLYSWLGADPLLMKKLIKMFPKANVVKLRHNFRSREEILYGASAVIANNRTRIKKRILATRGPGMRIIIRPSDSANQLADSIADRIKVFINSQGYAPERIAVLARKRIAWRHVCRVLEERGIACAADKTASRYSQKTMRTLLNYMKAIAHPGDEKALAAIINSPRRGIGEKTVSLIRQTAKQRQCSFPEAIKVMIRQGTAHDHLNAFSRTYSKWRKLARKPPITLARAIIDGLALDATDLRPLLNCMTKYPSVKAFLEDFRPYSHKYVDNLQQPGVRFKTIHGAKGMEFDVVFIVGMEHGVLPDERALKIPAALEEERRLAYVAMTRPRDRLFIYYLKDSRRITNLRVSSPSRFITEIPDEYKYYPEKSQRPHGPGAAISERTVTDHVVGDTAIHATYGYGRISKISMPYAIVKFSSSGVRKLLLASLQKARVRKV